MSPISKGVAPHQRSPKAGEEMEASKGSTEGNRKGSSSTRQEWYASSASSTKGTHEIPSSSPTLFSFDWTHPVGEPYTQAPVRILGPEECYEADEPIEENFLALRVGTDMTQCLSEGTWEQYMEEEWWEEGCLVKFS